MSHTTSASHARMNRVLPPFTALSPTMHGLLGAYSGELDLVYDALKGVDGVLASFYAATATDHGLVRWETMLGLESSPSDSLDERRSQVIAKMVGFGSVTPDRVKAVANAFENGLVDIIEDFEHYRIILRFVSAFGVPANVPRMLERVRAILPAHLVLEVQYTYRLWGQWTEENAVAGRDWAEYSALAIPWGDVATIPVLG